MRTSNQFTLQEEEVFAGLVQLLEAGGAHERCACSRTPFTPMRCCPCGPQVSACCAAWSRERLQLLCRAACRERVHGRRTRGVSFIHSLSLFVYLVMYLPMPASIYLESISLLLHTRISASASLIQPYVLPSLSLSLSLSLSRFGPGPQVPGVPRHVADLLPQQGPLSRPASRAVSVRAYRHRALYVSDK
jgi:hypothetical protein